MVMDWWWSESWTPELLLAGLLAKRRYRLLAILALRRHRLPLENRRSLVEQSLLQGLCRRHRRFVEAAGKCWMRQLKGKEARRKDLLAMQAR